jgi:hypothetical protein
MSYVSGLSWDTNWTYVSDVSLAGVLWSRKKSKARRPKLENRNIKVLQFDVEFPTKSEAISLKVAPTSFNISKLVFVWTRYSEGRHFFTCRCRRPSDARK